MFEFNTRKLEKVTTNIECVPSNIPSKKEESDIDMRFIMTTSREGLMAMNRKKEVK